MFICHNDTFNVDKYGKPKLPSDFIVENYSKVMSSIKIKYVSNMKNVCQAMANIHLYNNKPPHIIIIHDIHSLIKVHPKIKPSDDTEYGAQIARILVMFNETSKYVNGVLTENDKNTLKTIQKEKDKQRRMNNNDQYLEYYPNPNMNNSINSNNNNNNNNNNNSSSNINGQMEKTRKMRCFVSLEIENDNQKHYWLSHFYNYFHKWSFNRILFAQYNESKQLITIEIDNILNDNLAKLQEKVASKENEKKSNDNHSIINDNTNETVITQYSFIPPNLNNNKKKNDNDDVTVIHNSRFNDKNNQQQQEWMHNQGNDKKLVAVMKVVVNLRTNSAQNINLVSCWNR